MYPLPEYRYIFSDFLSSLRFQRFHSQQAAADYFGCHRATITRYENGSPLPPVGYLAHLAQLVYEKSIAEERYLSSEQKASATRLEQGSSAQEVMQTILLDDINRAIRYNYKSSEPSFGIWDALVDCGERYMATRSKRDTDVEPPPSAKIVRRIAKQGPHSKPDCFQLRGFWGLSPDVSNFCDRVDEVESLTDWVVGQQCRVVTIAGLGGMGKSMLAKKFAEDIAPNFEAVIWISLRHATPIDELLRTLLQHITGSSSVVAQPDPAMLDEQTEQVGDSSQVQQLQTAVIEALQTNRCLLVLDNFETLLQTGVDAGTLLPAFSTYTHLLHHLCTVPHQSCVLITTREVPAQIMQHERDDGPVRLMTLAGVETSTVRLVLSGKQLRGVQAHWDTLVQALSGNLLALEMTGSLVRTLYDGDIGRFLGDTESIVLDDVEKLIHEQYSRLSELEREILIWLAIEQEPVLAGRLQQNLQGRATKRSILSILQRLFQRSLIVRSENGYTLHELVATFLLQRLLDDIYAAITANDEQFTQQIDCLNRFALVKASSKSYIRHIQEQTLLEPLAAMLLADYQTANGIVERINLILNKLRPHKQPGYAGGNLFNLLRYMKQDLSTVDFSNLPVWQAYMLDLPLHDVNFAGADLRSSLFTQIFDRVLCIAYSPDGSLLATGTANGEIQLWDTNTRGQHLRLSGHNDWVRRLVFTPDGNYLFSASDDATICQWDVQTGQRLRTLHGHSGRVLALAIDATGQVLASAGQDAEIRLWIIENGELIRSMTGHESWIWSLAFHPTQNKLISGSGDSTIRVWDPQTGTCKSTLAEHTSWVWELAFSPDGRYFASCGDDQTTRLWDNETNACRHTWTVQNRARGLAFSPDSRTVASGDYDNLIHLWDINTHEQIAELKTHDGHLWALAFSPSSQELASSADDNQLCLWNSQTYQLIGNLSGYNPAIYALEVWHPPQDEGQAKATEGKRRDQIGPPQSLLACAGGDQRIHLWSLDGGSDWQTLTGHNDHVHDDRIHSLAFMLDGKSLVSGGGDSTVRLWHLGRENSHASNQMTIHTPRDTWVRGVALAPKRNLLGAVHDTHIQLWELDTGKPIRTLPEAEREFYSLDIDPHERWIAAGCEDHQIWLWDLENERGWQHLSGHEGVIWHVHFWPDGEHLLSASEDHTVRLWHVPSRQCINVFSGHTDTVVNAVLSPCGGLIASGSLDATVRLWDVETAQCKAVLSGHTSTVYIVRFIDKNTLASGSKDGTVRLWDVATQKLIRVLQPERLCERMNITGVTGISDAERESLKALGAVDIGGQK